MKGVLVIKKYEITEENVKEVFGEYEGGDQVLYCIRQKNEEEDAIEIHSTLWGHENVAPLMWRYIDGEKVEQMGNTIEGLFRFKEAG